MHASAYLAETSLGQELTAKNSVGAYMFGRRAVLSDPEKGAPLHTGSAVAKWHSPSRRYSTEPQRVYATNLVIAASLLLSTAAYGHSWYPKDCCHDADCRPVPCGELVETRHGLVWRGVVFNKTQVKPSQDQFCHVCAKRQEGTMLPYLPLCVFVAPTS